MKNNNIHPLQLKINSIVGKDSVEIKSIYNCSCNVPIGVQRSGIKKVDFDIVKINHANEKLLTKEIMHSFDELDLKSGSVIQKLPSGNYEIIVSQVELLSGFKSRKSDGIKKVVFMIPDKKDLSTKKTSRKTKSTTAKKRSTSKTTSRKAATKKSTSKKK